MWPQPTTQPLASHAVVKLDKTRCSLENRNPLADTYCRDWNILPGAVGHIPDTTCTKDKMCTHACNCQLNAWCFVREGCATHRYELTSVETPRQYDADYSHEICGSANRRDNVEDNKFDSGSNCPEGPGCDHFHHCECLFKGTALPAGVSTVLVNPLCGTNCEIAWNLLSKTKGYTVHHECMKGQNHAGNDVDPDKCSKEYSWHYDHWCYAEMMSS